MKQETEQLEKFLMAQGVRVTAPRRKILQQLVAYANKSQGASQNFTAEQLCEQMKDDKEVSRATVYRTLKLMADTGALKAIDTGTGAQCYLLQWSRKVPMAELVCMDCGRVEVLEAPFMQWYAQGAAQKAGLTALEGRLQVRGECNRLKNGGTCPHLNKVLV